MYVGRASLYDCACMMCMLSGFNYRGGLIGPYVYVYVILLGFSCVQGIWVSIKTKKTLPKFL